MLDRTGKSHGAIGSQSYEHFVGVTLGVGTHALFRIAMGLLPA